MTQFRDLTVIPLSNGEQLVIACDSSAGIGLKPGDSVRADPSVTAAFCLRVPLLELLAVGAEPIAVIDLIGNEYDETGRQMIAGVTKELTAAGFPDIPLNGSTEENMLTVMSTIGITVVGKVKAGSLMIGRLQAGDNLFYVGTPYVGAEVIAHLEDIFTYEDLRHLLADQAIKEIVPVGSKGILFEANSLAESSQLIVELDEGDEDDLILRKSAGPATVLVIGVDPNDSERLKKMSQVTYIGTVKERVDEA